MGKRLKVMTIVGTRPEIVKLSRVLAELEKHTDHVLVHSGQNYDYGLNGVFFDQLGIAKPKYVLGVGGQSVAQAIADVIARTDQVMEEEQPEAILLYGDTNTCLAVIPAKRRKIPVFHMEAGNRCFDQRVPEELNRKVVDHLSDVNMPLTEHARRYLLAEGLRPETVIKIGSTMKEVLEHYAPAIARSKALEELKLSPGGYVLVSAHREENVDDPARLARILEILRAVAARHGKRIVMSTHPRTKARLAALAAETKALEEQGIGFLPPFGFLDWVKLQESAFCVLSDSGTLTEESALLGFPAVMLREAHERPEGMDAGALVMAGLDVDRVLQAIEVVTEQPAGPRELPPDYAVPAVARKVVRIVLSYVDYVNRTVWRKA